METFGKIVRWVLGIGLAIGLLLALWFGGKALLDIAVDTNARAKANQQALDANQRALDANAAELQKNQNALATAQAQATAQAIAPATAPDATVEAVKQELAKAQAIATAEAKGPPAVIEVQPRAGSSYPISQIVNAQNGTTVPTWAGQYGDASRTGTEEEDNYPLYPFSSYLVIAGEFNGIVDAVHLIWVQAETEQGAKFVNAEVIPAKQGVPLQNVYEDGILLAAFKASVQGKPSLPFYTWTMGATGAITPGLPK